MVFGTIIQALFYFLPGYFANGFPVFLAKYRIGEFLNVPIDLGYEFKGERLFGRTKTWRGIIGGTLIAMLVGMVQVYLIFRFDGLKWLNFGDLSIKKYLLISLLQGLGVGFGDLIKSFFKRRLHIKSTNPFVPFDQMDFVGGLLFSFLIFIPDFGHLLAILIISPLLPVIANLIAFKLGWKKIWW